VEIGSVTPKPQVRISHLVSLPHTHPTCSPEIHYRVFSISPKILLLLTVMVFLLKAMLLFFHVSVRASLRSLRLLKNPWPRCDTAGSSRLIWGRTRKVHKTPLMTLSRASMRLLPMPMCSWSTFLARTHPAYGACDVPIVLLSLTIPRC
jgi:hypothetical protein